MIHKTATTCSSGHRSPGTLASGCGASMTATVVTAPPADPSLTNTGAPNPLTSGQHLTYTLHATNTSGQPPTAVKVTDPLPAGAVFGAKHTTQCTCTRTVTAANPDGTITCRLGTLPVGATATVTLTVTPTIEGGTLTSTARVTATNVSKDTNDQATATVTVHGD
jgi:uncharacterized repeat protein (TIGR01451 family)